MLLGFKRRFEPFILDGSKTHTIRGKRQRPPRVGETCHCYVDPRQKTMRLLGRWPCVRVDDIHISVAFDIFVNGELLAPVERNQLAWRDGFRSDVNEAYLEMSEFWRGRLPFDGTIIHWDFTKPLEVRNGH
jgi:hypothetical protein